MKKTLIPIFAAMIYMPVFVQAEIQQKQLSAGLSSFVSSISENVAYQSESMDFSGLSFFVTGAVNNNLGIRAMAARQSLDLDTNFKVNAFEGMILAGTGLAEIGFKIYGSLGFYSDTWTYIGEIEKYNFSGGMLGGGLGYNWDSVSLDFWMNLRDSAEYDLAIGIDTTVFSGALGLAARF